jgi:segregation and condensation protein A
MFHHKAEQFEGPLSLLLQLIEKDELEITEISLAKVTEDFLICLKSEKIPEDELADFLVIAAKLLLLKSKSILPNLVLNEDDGISLEDQLKMYKEFVEAAKKIEDKIKKKNFAFFRETIFKPEDMGFFPPKGLNSGKMRQMFEEILERLKPLLDLPKTILEKTISIKEKIQHIHNLLAQYSRVGFSKILNNAKNRTEVIVSFLALLELTKQRRIMVAQGDNFEEIMIEKI